MSQFDLIERLNNSGIEINKAYIERQITTLSEELNQHLEKIKNYVIAKGSTPIASNIGSDAFQKQFINRIFKKKRVERLSSSLLEELFDQTGDDYFLTLQQYRKVSDRLNKYQKVLDAVSDTGKIMPVFAINSAQSVYTAKPALTFQIQELELMFGSKSKYYETLVEALQFVMATSHNVVAVVKTTVYYRENEHQMRVEHVQKTLDTFNAMMDSLSNHSTKFGKLKIDYEELKIIECDIEVEKLLLEEKLDYWMDKFLQTSLIGNMKTVRNKTFKLDDAITSLTIIHNGTDQYVVRLHVKKNRVIKGSVVKNPEKTETVFDILRCRELSQVFNQVSILRRAFSHRFELENMASSGDFLAWDIVNKLFKETHDLDHENTDYIRFIKRMIFNREASWILSEEDAPELADYKELQSKISSKEAELELKRIDLKEKEKVIDDHWRTNEFDRNIKMRTKAEVEEIERQIYDLEKDLRTDGMKVRQLEKVVDESVWKILWQIVEKHAKSKSEAGIN